MNNRFDLAIWLESDELPRTDQQEANGDSRASGTSGIQVHLNFWKLPKCNAVDIGINFPIFENGKVNIFIDTTSKIEAEDITCKLKDDSIINTIFNEFINSETCKHQIGCKKCKRSSGQADFFCLRCLEDSSKLKQDKKYNGTLITFNISATKCITSCDCKRQYIRLRLSGEAIDKIYIKDKMPAARLQYYTSRIDFLDFRLNNVRSLPQSLTSKVIYPTLDSIRCFLMLESGEELLLHSKEYKKVRAIEKEKWPKYLEALTPYVNNKDESGTTSFFQKCKEYFKKFLPSERKKNKFILAYQWSTDTPDQDFSLFVQIKRSDFFLRTVIVFILITTFFGLFPSILASYVDKGIKHLWQLIFG